MAMVRHIIDVVGRDVNGPDQPPGRRETMHFGTRICYIPGSSMTDHDTDTRELTWLLLGRGADPAPALIVTEQYEYPRFTQNVEDWMAQRGRGGPKQLKKDGARNCCVQ
jgi:hypothetical protein